MFDLHRLRSSATFFFASGVRKVARLILNIQTLKLFGNTSAEHLKELVIGVLNECSTENATMDSIKALLCMARK